MIQLNQLILEIQRDIAKPRHIQPDLRIEPPLLTQQQCQLPKHLIRPDPLAMRQIQRQLYLPLPGHLLQPIYHHLELVPYLTISKINIEFLDILQSREGLNNPRPVDDVAEFAEIEGHFFDSFQPFDEGVDVLGGGVVDGGFREVEGDHFDVEVWEDEG